MRVLISSLLVVLVSLAGSALTPVAAASPGVASQDVSRPAPLVDKATYRWRRHYGYGYGWRPYRRRHYGYGYGYGYPRYYGYYHYPRYYGWRRRHYRRHYW